MGYPVKTLKAWLVMYPEWYESKYQFDTTFREGEVEKIKNIIKKDEGDVYHCTPHDLRPMIPDLLSAIREYERPILDR